MPAAAAGNGAAAHALCKLIAQEAALVPSMAAPIQGGGLVQISVSWLEGANRLSYNDDDVVEATTPATPVLEARNGPTAEPWRPLSPTGMAAVRKAGRESVAKQAELPDLW